MQGRFEARKSGEVDMYFFGPEFFLLNEHHLYSSLSSSFLFFHELLLAPTTISRRAIHELSPGTLRSQHLRNSISFLLSTIVSEQRDSFLFQDLYSVIADLSEVNSTPESTTTWRFGLRNRKRS